MSKPENTELDSQTDFDTTAAVAEISADLFGQGGESGGSEEGGSDAGTKEAPENASSVEQPSSQPSPTTDVDKATQQSQPPSPDAAGSPPENSAEVQALGAPKSWSKEALADWATLPPRTQQEILKREEDFLRGITMYREGAELAQRYDKVVEPYKPILAAENIDPVQLFQSFAANHYLLSRGTEEQKLELAANLIQGYGIDFSKLITFVGDRVLEPADPRIAALEKEIAEMKSATSSRQQQEQVVAKQTLEKEIEDFAKDPAHPYFEELVNDIAQLFETRQASTLKEAYEKAVFANPVTRQKEIERLTVERASSLAAAEQAKQQKIATSTAADLRLDPKSGNGTVPLGSIDDTLRETMARLQSQG